MNCDVNHSYNDANNGISNDVEQFYSSEGRSYESDSLYNSDSEEFEELPEDDTCIGQHSDAYVNQQENERMRKDESRESPVSIIKSDLISEPPSLYRNKVVEVNLATQRMIDGMNEVHYNSDNENMNDATYQSKYNVTFMENSYSTLQFQGRDSPISPISPISPSSDLDELSPLHSPTDLHLPPTLSSLSLESITNPSDSILQYNEMYLTGDDKLTIPQPQSVVVEESEPPPPSHPSKEKTQKRRRNHEIEEEPEKKKIKRNREHKHVPTDFPDGEKVDLRGLKVTEEDKRLYDRINNYYVPCSKCKDEKSICNLYSYGGKFICLECVESKKIPKEELKQDFFEHLERYEGLEDLDFKTMKLIKCVRLKHAKPSFCYVEFTKRSEYKYEKNCVYCRNYKKLEYKLKDKNKRKDIE